MKHTWLKYAKRCGKFVVVFFLDVFQIYFNRVYYFKHPKNKINIPIFQKITFCFCPPRIRFPYLLFDCIQKQLWTANRQRDEFSEKCATLSEADVQRQHHMNSVDYELDKWRRFVFIKTGTTGILHTVVDQGTMVIKI